MTHGYEKTVYRVCTALTVMVLFALAVIDQKLKSSLSPLGIVSFELCAYSATCASMIARWEGEAKLYAALSLGLDYLFMLAYPAAMSGGLWLLRSEAAPSLRTAALAMMYAVWLAGFADAVENYHLFQMLLGHSVETHQWPATLAATFKFVCLAPALVLWLFMTIRSKARGRSE